MSNRKPGVTFDRHKQIGTELKKVQRLLVSLAVEIQTAYAKNGPAGRAADKLLRAERSLLHARSALEDVMTEEVGGGQWVALRLADVYFGTLPGERGHEDGQPTKPSTGGQ